MHESSLTDIIVSSDILMSAERADAPSLVIHIGRPVPAPEIDWQCSHQITGLAGEEEILTAYGVDAFQSLCLCIRLVNTRVLAIERRLGIRFPGL